MTTRAMTARATTSRLAFASPAATRALAAGVLVAAVATLAASARLGSARDAALTSARDLASVRADLRDLGAWHATSRAGTDAADANPELNRRVRRAATAAKIGDQLASIEPGPPIRERDSDVVRTPIYLRLDGVTLRQVATFVAELTANDASLRATGIEFSAPPTAVRAAAAAAGDELWTSDVMLSESTVAASQQQQRASR